MNELSICEQCGGPANHDCICEIHYDGKSRPITVCESCFDDAVCDDDDEDDDEEGRN